MDSPQDIALKLANVLASEEVARKLANVLASEEIALKLANVLASKDIALKLAGVLADKNDRLKELRLIVDACPLAMFITDEHGTCVYINVAYQKLIDRAEDQIVGEGWKQAIHPEDRPVIDDFWKNKAVESTSFARSYRYVRPDGEIVPVFCNAVKLPSLGYVGYVNATDSVHCTFKCAIKLPR